MSSKNPVEIVVIADRSGSMGTIRDDAIGGFNQFLKEQQELEGDANLTLVLFNDEYDIAVKSTPIDKVQPLTESTYVPARTTALNDAIGKTVSLLRKANPERVIVCILTDGMENSSKEYSTQQVKELIEEVEGKDWQVVYLAANQDAFSEGMARGISHSINYAATTKGIRTAYSDVSDVTTAYRTGQG